jgi:hypothetical protein
MLGELHIIVSSKENTEVLIALGGAAASAVSEPSGRIDEKDSNRAEDSVNISFARGRPGDDEDEVWWISILLLLMSRHLHFGPNTY